MISLPPLPKLLLADGEPGRLITTPPSRPGLLKSPGVQCRWVSFHNPHKSTDSREVKP